MKKTDEQGNAMIYILIALALFGFLTVALSRQNDQADGQDLTDEQVQLYANELIQYTVAAEHVIDQMLATGSEVDDLVFLNPGSAGFDTGSHIHKVFHPLGGGLNYQATYSEEIENSAGSGHGWYFDNLGDVEWTETTGDDVILSALEIKESVCEEINRKITGSTTIPQITTGLGAIFDPAVNTTDLTTTSCAGCDGFPSLCVENSAGTGWGFYTIIGAQ